jgi:hypothetical protein
MISIENYGNGYKIKLSNPGSGMRGFSVFASNLGEVHLAIDHYCGNHHASINVPQCPLCRNV